MYSVIGYIIRYISVSEITNPFSLFILYVILLEAVGVQTFPGPVTVFAKHSVTLERALSFVALRDIA